MPSTRLDWRWSCGSPTDQDIGQDRHPTAQEISDRNRPWEVDFDHWAWFDRDRLLDYLRDQDAGIGLTFAAEAARIVSDPRVVAAVVALLDHPHPTVREGAILGLHRNADDGARSKIKQMAIDDPSPGVRATAEDTVFDWSMA